VEARSRRTASIPAAAAAIAAAGCAVALAAAGDASPARAKAQIDLKLATASQKQILEDGALTVEVSSKDAGKARVRGAAGSGKPVKVAKRRVVRLEAGDTVTVKLPLTDAGRARIGACGDQDILIRARATQAGDRLGDRDDDRDKVRQALVRDSAACALSSGPGEGGGGGPGAGTGGGGGHGANDPSVTERCDPFDSSACLYPWPNDYFTKPAATPTGRQLNLNVLSMPSSRAGVPVLPEPFNRSDGFSPGNLIATKVPGLDTQAELTNDTGAAPITDIEESLELDQPIVVINADTGERQLIFSEIDANPSDPDDRALIIRPGENFEEGERYIVALRSLRDSSGPIAPDPVFEDYRDATPTGDPVLEARRPHMEQIFSELAQAQGAPIARDDLYLAWDFTVASRENLSERALFMRNDAFSQLGDSDLDDMVVPGGSDAPAFTVDSVTPMPADPEIGRVVEGTFEVPCYLNLPGCPTGSQFLFQPGTNLPQAIPGNTMDANFTCIISKQAVDPLDLGPPASRPSLYGHGLLGSASEVSGGNVQAMAGEHNFTFCATDWAGFATGDAPTILTVLQDLNHFPKFVDRTQQGFLNFLFLGRLMIHPDGFVTDPAFQAGSPAEPVLDTQRLFYDGNSQGGILGGALASLAPDYDRAVLGVPGMNYSTLLRRSSDFHPYAEGEFTGIVCGELPSPFREICEMAPGDTPLGLYDNYPNELERPLILSLMQLQWDRAEANGYAHHITDDPLPDTPAHKVLMHVAFGDHQVSMWTAEIEARTIGASINWPAIDEGRHPDDGPDPDEPLFGIPHIGAYPFPGSAMIYWDSGPGQTLPPPTTNTPPGSPQYGNDPHGHPRNTVAARLQKSEFLKVNGAVVDVCGGLPCHTDQYLP
jgi:hypothetical protein